MQADFTWIVTCISRKSDACSMHFRLRCQLRAAPMHQHAGESPTDPIEE